jgi:hypothetical protein
LLCSKPQKDDIKHKKQKENDKNKAILSKFSQDLTVVLQETIEKSINHLKKQYEND